MDTQGTNKKWVLKKKFTFAGVALAAATLFALWGMWIGTTVADVVSVMVAYTTASGAVLMLIFAADVADKKLNSGQYNPNDH